MYTSLRTIINSQIDQRLRQFYNIAYMWHVCGTLHIIQCEPQNTYMKYGDVYAMVNDKTTTLWCISMFSLNHILHNLWQR